MGNLVYQPSTKSPNKRDRVLANASLILGLLGFVLPILAFMISHGLISFIPLDKIEGINYPLIDIFVEYIFIAGSIAGPFAIILGIVAYSQLNRENFPIIWKYKAAVGIGLGILTILVVLLPLLVILRIQYNCVKYGYCI